MDPYTVSYSNLWEGSFGPTIIADTCREAHSENQPIASFGSESGFSYGSDDAKSRTYGSDDAKSRTSDSARNDSASTGIMLRNSFIRPVMQNAYGSVENIPTMRSIRFQVVVWNIGSIDVLAGRVTCKFRLTLFWNDVDDAGKANGRNGIVRSNSFKMMSRGRAILEDDVSVGDKRKVDIPPASILNAESFDVIGQPEVHLLRKDTKLMRWTCLYKASLMQEKMKINKFPHDQHVLQIKIGILANRQKGQLWDKSVWKLELATKDDSKDSTRVPHGLIVDHVKIPEFKYDSGKGLNFNFVPVGYGDRSVGGAGDECLEVSLKVSRESGYYDRNVIPLLALLNIVGATVLVMHAKLYFQRALLLLNITFVQVGLRMSLDAKLPSVGYEIKMQKIMNNYFYSLLFLAIESSFLYYCLEKKDMPLELSDKIDLVAVISVLVHGISQAIYYYEIFEFRE